VSRAREAFTRALAASLGYAAGVAVVVLIDVAAEAWIERRAAVVDEGQAVLDDQADEQRDERERAR
jgi:hypothetical protein